MSTLVKQEEKVSNQTEALGLYLDALFREQPEVDQSSVIEAPITAPAVQIVTAVSIPENTVMQTDLEPEEALAPIELADGQPEWAAEAFQTLFIDIDGMDIAIPMEAMSGIRKYPEHLTQIPNSAEWVDGTIQLRGVNIQVVNARKLFLLSNNREIDDAEELKTPEFIVQIGDGRWGLACHSADRALMLEPDQVRWSGSERRRPWLLGMIKEHLCALLDGDEFIKYLDGGAKSV